MSNPLFNGFGNNPMMQIIQQIQNFQKNFKGDAKSEVEQMMKDGRLSQDQFNQLSQQANQIAHFMGMMPK